MTERLLHYIWQFQHFNRDALHTTEGEPVHVYFPGHYNSNQGPDFTNARVRVGTTTWVGTAELHVRSGDWHKHKHGEDPNYKNVILHVVWEEEPGDGKSTTHLPVLELKNRVPGLLLQRYEALMQTGTFIPCEQLVTDVPALTWQSWKDRLLAERLLRKAGQMEAGLRENNYHWEESFWWLLARSFGIPVNASAFEEMARSLPLKLLARHRSSSLQLEALLLGQAGLLDEEPRDAYQEALQKEYHFLREKYKLQPNQLPVHFLRMRPVNFPGIRLAQLAALLGGSARLFSRVKETMPALGLRNIFTIRASGYWDTHYRFGEVAKPKEKKLGSHGTATIIINAIAPAIFAYGQYQQEEKYKQQALHWLEQTSAEKNSITRGFVKMGVPTRTAADSQALIELKNEYCNHKRCLECAVGIAVLKTKATGDQPQAPQSTDTSISG